MGIVQTASAGGKGASLLEVARELAGRFGWSLIPVRGKRAVGSWERFQTARPGQRELARMFQNSKATGIAVLCGEVSGGLAVRDFDTMEGYDRWAGEHKALAKSLPTVRTGRGMHVYCRGPELFMDVGDGEYRGTSGQYVLTPPSLHP